MTESSDNGISREDAARALREAEAFAERSTAAIGYQRFSGYLFVWGAVWIALSIAAFLRAPHGEILWPLFMTAGVAASIWLAWRAGGATARGKHALSSLIVAVALVLFFSGAAAAIPGLSLKQGETLTCLALGAAYMVLGVSVGRRLSLVGAGLMAATIAVSLYGEEAFFLWMALAGGGGFIAGGLWLRRA